MKKASTPPPGAMAAMPPMPAIARVEWPKGHEPANPQHMAPGKSVKVTVHGKVHGVRLGGDYGGHVEVKPSKITVHPATGEPDADEPMTDQIQRMRGGQKTGRPKEPDADDRSRGAGRS